MASGRLKLLAAAALATAGLLAPTRARYVLEREQLVPAPAGCVFDFFADPRNLPRITPDWIGFEVLNLERVPLAGGTMQHYRIRWFRVPMRWESLIAEYEHGRLFTDVQTRGPYRSWRHEHIFEPREGGTLVRDRVQYELPFALLGRLLHALIVRRQLDAIFDYRAKVIEAAFRAP